MREETFGPLNGENLEGGMLPHSLLALLLLFLPCSSSPLLPSSDIRRTDFPPDFVFGSGTSAYQAEGAVNEDGRGVSIWDTFTHSGKAIDGSMADVTADSYHHYKEDVKLMSEIGLESYRFSISWPRIIPNGSGAISQKGIEFYNNFINELISNGIQPHATLYHFDLPQALEDEYGGWLNSRIIDDFVAYANICFKEFGDRVLHWTTINEPNVFAIGAYDQGIIPPGRCSSPFGNNCTAGNSITEPYIAMHNFLLAHASVYQLYKTQYKATQKGLVGANLYAFTFYPKTNSTADVEACQRTYDFMFRWAMNPLLFGDYPEIMKTIVGSKMPSFSEEQSKLLRGSLDFLGINYYASLYISDNPGEYDSSIQDFTEDIRVLLSVSKDSTPSGQVDPTHLSIDPDGLEHVLLFLKNNYEDLPIFIHENGFGTPYNVTINDTGRIDFFNTSIRGMLSAIRSGSNCRGFFAWSFLDVFETLSGFKSRYGLFYVDFEDDNRRRQPKLSALWYRDFLKKPKDLVAS